MFFIVSLGIFKKKFYGKYDIIKQISYFCCGFNITIEKKNSHSNSQTITYNDIRFQQS